MYYEFFYEGDCSCVCPQGWDVFDMRLVSADGVKKPSVDWDGGSSPRAAIVKWPVDPYREIDNFDADLLREQVKAWDWLVQEWARVAVW